MDIRYEKRASDIRWDGVAALIEAVGWPPRSAHALREASARGTYVRIAYHRDKIVGFGRSVDDGKYYGMVVDLVVDPEYQRRGIGAEILRQLREEMAKEGFCIISLVAIRGKEEFYLKQGWKRSETAFHWSRRHSHEPHGTA